MDYLRSLFGKKQHPLTPPAPPSITELKNNRDVDGLIRALTYNQYVNGRVPEWGEALGYSKFRCEAAEALGEIGDPSAIEALVSSLEKDYVPDVQIAAIFALEKIGTVSALDTIVDAVVNWVFNPPIHTAAISALGRLGELSIKPLIIALENGAGRIESEKEDYLRSELIRRWEYASERIVVAFEKIGNSAVLPLVAILQSESTLTRTRLVAATALGRIGDERALASLQGILTDERLRKVGEEAIILLNKE